MAKPRIFISSTFYDLRQVRADLERFINELGYESILNEKGNISYGNNEKLEEYCYKEVESADILVAVVGGRYGSTSKNDQNSVTQREIKTALKANKQVYMFVEKSVLLEFETYLLNKNIKEIRYRYVDNTLIFEFINEFKSLLKNNTMHGFETSQDIISFLKEQWAGLFQRFLQEQSRIEEVNLINGIQTTASTLNQLVTFLTNEKKDKDQAIKDILLSNHPAMRQVRNLLNIKYRVYFTTEDELDKWLEARRFERMINIFVKEDEEEFLEWCSETGTTRWTLKVQKDIFDDKGKLKAFTDEEWNESNILLESGYIEQVAATTDDGDIPF